MGGVDFRLSKDFGIGPFVDFSLAEYTHIKVTAPGLNQSASVSNKAVHEWLALGIRAVLFP